MTIVEAVKKVMLDSGRALSPSEAYSLILKNELYSFKADKPLQVVRGQIRRHCLGIDFPSSSPVKHFQVCEDGKYYPINDSTTQSQKSNDNSKAIVFSEADESNKLLSLSSQLKDLHRLYNEEIKRKLLNELKSLSPDSFEHFSNKIMEAYGFHSMKVTGVSRDGGIDGHGKLKVGLSEMNVAFQCKRWTKNSIHRPEIDKFRGAIQGEYEQGVFFTTANFTQGAKAVSIKRGAVPIILIDGQGIVDLMIKMELGVERESLNLYSYALDLVFED